MLCLDGMRLVLVLTLAYYYTRSCCSVFIPSPKHFGHIFTTANATHLITNPLLPITTHHQLPKRKRLAFSLIQLSPRNDRHSMHFDKKKNTNLIKCLEFLLTLNEACFPQNTPTGCIKSVDGFKPEIDATIMFGGDWLSFEPDNKSARMNLMGIAQ